MINGSVPFKTVITHGFVLDESGRKMSKSLGNVIDPATIIKECEERKNDPVNGLDVLRAWATHEHYTRDITVGPTVLSEKPLFFFFLCFCFARFCFLSG
jgi:isoleucyl-tRNA synthetase